MNRMNMFAMSVALAAQGSVFGGVVIHTSYASWSAAVGGGDAKIDFNLGSAQELFDQYGGLGAHFGGTLQTATTQGDPDGWAAVTLFPTFAMTADFDLPQTGVAFDVASLFKVLLFSNGVLVGEIPQLSTFAPVFRGVTSDQPFDRVVLQTLPGSFSGSLRNMYIGNPIPGPAGAGVLVLALLRGRRRRA